MATVRRWHGFLSHHPFVTFLGWELWMQRCAKVPSSLQWVLKGGTLPCKLAQYQSSRPSVNLDACFPSPEVGRKYFGTQNGWDRYMAGYCLGLCFRTQETALKLQPWNHHSQVIRVSSGFHPTFALTWSYGLSEGDFKIVKCVHSFIFASMPFSPRVIVQIVISPIFGFTHSLYSLVCKIST